MISGKDEIKEIAQNNLAQSTPLKRRMRILVVFGRNISISDPSYLAPGAHEAHAVHAAQTCIAVGHETSLLDHHHTANGGSESSCFYCNPGCHVLKNILF